MTYKQLFLRNSNNYTRTLKIIAYRVFKLG